MFTATGHSIHIILLEVKKYTEVSEAVSGKVGRLVDAEV